MLWKLASILYESREEFHEMARYSRKCHAYCVTVQEFGVEGTWLCGMLAHLELE